LIAICSLLVVTACNNFLWVCDDVDPYRIAQVPARLSETGLYEHPAEQTVAADVLAYAPQFQLWSDGAEKRRWAWFPPGAQIDDTDMDAWVFPQGTKFWKEFTRDGVRVETRLLQKVGPGDDDWVALAYLWDKQQRDAYATPYGAIDALGTPHNVPASSECPACHGGRKSFVLGFSAIQLSQPAQSGEADLARLVEANLLSVQPAGSFAVPGNDSERQALGYLHANCSHCHNQNRPKRHGARCFDPKKPFDFSLSVAALGSPTETATYRSAIDSVIKPGRPGKSRLIELVSKRGFGAQMPPLATERVDHAAVTLLSQWIQELHVP
jgi:hypothetical protein